MEKRASSALAVALASLAIVSTARADLTVSFATDGPAPTLSASVAYAEAVPEPEPARVEEEAPSITPVEVRFVRVGDGSGDTATLTLRDASGEPAEGALDRLSVLARPRGVDVPASLEGGDADFVAPGIRRLHAGLLPLLARLSAQFPDRAIEIVSGYRPNARDGSRHRFGRALDLRVAGIAIEEVRAFLDGEPCTGLGLYPTSDFVHLDVRTETVRWLDDSGPGEPQHVVRSEVIARSEVVERSETETPPTPVAPTDEPTTSDDEAIERAMRAADSILLDLGL